MDVKTIAVIGADATGRGIAYLAARAGYKLILEDVSDSRLASAIAGITESLGEAAACGSLEKTGCNLAIANLSTAHTVEDAIRDADLIIETLPNEMEMQVELFTIFDKFAKPRAIFASTGLISITELAEVTFCAERCIGMRFGARVAETKTIELVKGSETSRATVAACSEFARRVGMCAVIIDEPNASPSAERERKVANAQR